MLGGKADKALSQEMSEAINDAAIMEKLAKKPTQQTILNEPVSYTHLTLPTICSV